MKIFLSVVSGCIVKEFYKEHTFYFFVIVFFAFGIMKPTDHIVLNQYVIASKGFIGAYFILWTLYNAFVTLYFSRSLRQPKHHFLLDLYMAGPFTRFLVLGATHFQLLAPAFIYGAFVVSIAISMQYWLMVVWIFVFFGISILYPVFIYIKMLKTPDTGFGFSLISGLNKWYRKPRFTFFLFHLVHERQTLFFISKLFSCAFLTGSIVIFASGNEGIRPLLLAVLLASIANTMPVFYFHRFENFDLINFKNLPFTRFRLWLNALAVITILMIPECVLLAKYFPGDFSLTGYLECCFFMISIPALLYHYLYVKYMDNEQFIQKLYGVFGFYFICILFYVPGWLMAVTAFILSIILMNRFYYRYQSAEDK